MIKDIIIVLGAIALFIWYVIFIIFSIYALKELVKEVLSD